MKQKKIVAEQELRRAAIDRLIEACLADRIYAMELLLAKWRNESALDSGKFTITGIAPNPLSPPLIENTKREER